MASTFWARTDSGSANNPALNLTGDPAVEIKFVQAGAAGDLVLDVAGGSVDPDTQVEIGGSTYNFTFELSGFMPTLKKDGAQQVPDQFEGHAVYIVTVQDYPTAGETTRLSFLPDDLATQAEMDDFGNGAIDVQNVDTTSGGAVCFAAGTHILTPKGDILVEDLQAGDFVLTLDHRPQPILWISHSEHVWPGSSENELPVLISRGALGPDVPRRNLVVSQQHKVLLSDANARSHSSNAQVLAPAKGMTSLPGFRIMKGKRRVVYYHILLESHEILISEGLATESFYPSPTALKMLRTPQQEEIFSLFPGLEDDPAGGYGPRARRCLTCAQTKTLTQARGISTRNTIVSKQSIEPGIAA